MDFITQYVDPTILDDEGFPIGVLVYYHETLANIREHYSKLSQKPLMINQFSDIMLQLKIVEHNLMMMDIAIDNKKTLTFHPYSLEPELASCLN